MAVLGLETSCDETGVAIYGYGLKKENELKKKRANRKEANKEQGVQKEQEGRPGVLAEQLYSQVSLHKDFGGVIPEAASRDHVRKALPLVQAVVAESGLDVSQIEAVAYTAGPGLMGGLFVGAMLGRALAYGWGVKALAIHHMEGHLLAPMMSDDPPAFPFIALLVSGGHSQLVLAKALGQYELLGDTLDDAVGEVFDKVAKLLGLPYPGGPELEKLAAQCAGSEWRFPRPMVDRPGLEFSFSGLKTHCRNWCARLKANGQWSDALRAETAYAFQEAVFDTLRIKCLRALKQTQVTRLVVAGGVSANMRLRAVLEHALEAVGVRCWFPAPGLCADNGAMIAYAGWCRLQQGRDLGSNSLSVEVRPRWPLSQLE